MKLVLSLAEATSLIRQHFNLNSDVAVEITSSEFPHAPNGVVALVDHIRALYNNGKDMLKAVKFTRAITGLGIKEAKSLVEIGSRGEQVLALTNFYPRGCDADEIIRAYSRD